VPFLAQVVMNAVDAGAGQRPAGLWQQTLGLLQAWSDDRCSRKAAALSYYAAFSLAPLLVIVLAAGGLVMDSEVLGAALLDQVRQAFGQAGAELVEQMLVSSAKEEVRGWSVGIAIAVLFLGATTAFAELKSSLDDIWRVHADPQAVQRSGWWDLLRTRVLSLGLVLTIAFLLLTSLAMNAFLALAWRALSGWVGVAESTWLALAGELTTWLVVGALFTAIYRVLPEARLGWGHLLKAAAITTALFIVGKWGIGLYLANSAPASSFGAAGSLAILLLWMYYSASIFFLGAQIARLFVGVPNAYGEPSEPIAPIPPQEPQEPQERQERQEPQTLQARSTPQAERKLSTLPLQTGAQVRQVDQGR